MDPSAQPTVQTTTALDLSAGWCCGEDVRCAVETTFASVAFRVSELRVDELTTPMDTISEPIVELPVSRPKCLGGSI